MIAPSALTQTGHHNIHTCTSCTLNHKDTIQHNQDYSSVMALKWDASNSMGQYLSVSELFSTLFPTFLPKLPLYQTLPNKTAIAKLVGESVCRQGWSRHPSK